MDCTGSQGCLLRMYLWPHQWPWGLLVHLKCWKNLSPNLPGVSQLTLPGWWLPIHISLTNSFVPKQLPQQNPPNPQNLAASTHPQRSSAFNWVKVYSLVWPQEIPRFPLISWVLLSLAAQPPGGRTAMETQSSSVWMDVKLNNYSGQHWRILRVTTASQQFSHPKKPHEEGSFMEDVLETDLSWFWCAGCCSGCEMKKKIHAQKLWCKRNHCLVSCK